MTAITATSHVTETAGAPEIVVYTSAWCGYCMRAKALLERKGLRYSEIRVDEDPAGFQAMLVRSGGRRTVPQIFIGERHVGGSDDLYALESSGELDRILRGA